MSSFIHNEQEIRAYDASPTIGDQRVNAAETALGGNGVPGTKWFSGSGVPAAGLGIVGDFYFEVSNKGVYGPKTISGWGSVVPLAGANGAAGIGIPAGGTIGQVLKKVNAVDFNAQWGEDLAGGGAGATNLTYDAATRVIASDTGTDATLPIVVAAGNAGLISSADKTKLDGIAATAQVNDTAAQILTKLLTVDGATSGLDADLLDGISSAGFATAAQGTLAASALQTVAVPANITATGTASSSTFLRGDGAWATPAGAGDMSKAENLSGLANYTTARSNMGLGNAAQLTVDADIATLSLPEYTTISVAGAALIDDESATAQIATLGLDADIATLSLPASTTISVFGASVVDDTDAAAARTTLGLGTAATTAATAYATAAQGTLAASAYQPAGTDVAITDGGTGSSTAAGARTNLGLVIGTDVQAFDAELAAIAALVSAADRLAYFSGSGTALLATFTAAARTLVAAADAAAQRVALGLVIGTDVPAVSKTINAQTGTAYTLVLADAGRVVTCSNAAAVSVTVPPNSTSAFPIGTEIDVIGIGAGIVTVALGAGVTVNATPSRVFRARHSGATLLKVDTNTWQLVGDLA